MPFKLSPDCIVLAEPEKLHYPGDTVSGHIVLKFEKFSTCRAITLTIKGKAETGWDNVTKVGQWTYFNESGVIWKAETSENRIEPGTHRIPFDYTVPENIPQSFEGPFGFIRFYIKVHMDRPHALDQCVKKEFLVTQKPTVVSKEHLGPEHVIRYCQKLNCNRGEVYFEAQLSNRIIFFDDPISLIIKLKNCSSRTVKKISLEAFQRIEYYSTTSACRKTHSVLIGKTRKSELKIRNDEIAISTFSMKFKEPATPSFASELIQVSYVLLVNLFTDGFWAVPLVFPVEFEVGKKAGVLPKDEETCDWLINFDED